MNANDKEKLPRWPFALAFLLILVTVLDVIKNVNDGASAFDIAIQIIPVALVLTSIVVACSSRLWRSPIARGAAGLSLMLSLLWFAGAAIQDAFSDSSVADTGPAGAASLWEHPADVLEKVLWWPGTSIFLAVLFLAAIGYSVFNDAFGPDRTSE